MKPASPLALFAFLALRTFAGAARRRLRRLKEPRYLLGTAFALLYFGMILTRPGRHPSAAPVPLKEIPPQVTATAAFALTALALLTWILRPARAALPLSEAEAQFLFPAPLTRRSVVRYALVRGQLAILLGALFLAIVYRTRGLASFVPAWLGLSVVNLHAQGIGFTKAAWNERAPRLRSLLFGGLFVVALAALALSFGGLVAALGLARVPGPVARAGAALLVPAKLLLAPLLRIGPPPLPALLPALGIVVLHFLWVDRSAARFEEATLALAARRAEMRRQGIVFRPSGVRRDRVPFPLAPTGRPETAIFWKNLAGIRRTPLATQALLALGLAVVFFAGAAGVVASAPDRLLAVQTGVIVCFAAGLALALFTPFAQRDDFRSDLLLAEVLRSWPVAPARLAAGELAAPLFAGTFRLGVGLLAAAALSLGGAAGLKLSRAFVAFPHDQTLVALARPASILPWAAAALVSVPPLLALLLVVQNAATLAFPAWFPPGPRRTAGPEVSGMRILAFLATLLLLAMALVPSALLVAIAAFLGRGLGTAFLPALPPIAALPLAVEAAAGTWALGKLLERYDPAAEAGA